MRSAARRLGLSLNITYSKVSSDSTLPGPTFSSATLVAYGDVGGFGIASDLTRQLMGLVGYRFNDWIDGAIGYRHLSVDYSDDGFLWDVGMSGPIIGAVFRF